MPLKPVVFVPGFPASELVRITSGRKVFPPEIGDLDPSDKPKLIERLCAAGTPQDELKAGEPIRRVLEITKQAVSLYERLQEYGYTIGSGDNFRAVGWDWRKGVDDVLVQAAVAGAIDELSQRNGGARVVVLVHSTGGLVFRALLEARPSLAAKIDQVLAFGVPWAGTLKALHFLEEGEKIGVPFRSLTAKEVRTIMRHAQAAYDLCPPDPQKTAMQSAAGKNLNLFVSQGTQVGPMVSLTWAGSPPEPPILVRAARADARLGSRSPSIVLNGAATPPITNVVGWGGMTAVSRIFRANGEIKYEMNKEGDETVAAVSASWLRGPTVRTFFVPIGSYATATIPSFHSRIWEAPPLLELFDQVLLDKVPDVFVCGCADSHEAIDRQSPVTFRFSAIDQFGVPLPGAEVTFPGVLSGAKRFGGEPRVERALKRTNLHANVAGNLFRFVAEISWTGGKREVPLLIRL